MEKSLTEKIILAASANNLGELIRLTGLQMQDLDYDEKRVLENIANIIKADNSEEYVKNLVRGNSENEAIKEIVLSISPFFHDYEFDKECVKNKDIYQIKGGQLEQFFEDLVQNKENRNWAITNAADVFKPQKEITSSHTEVIRNPYVESVLAASNDVDFILKSIKTEYNLKGLDVALILNKTKDNEGMKNFISNPENSKYYTKDKFNYGLYVSELAKYGNKEFIKDILDGKVEEIQLPQYLNINKMLLKLDDEDYYKKYIKQYEEASLGARMGELLSHVKDKEFVKGYLYKFCEQQGLSSISSNDLPKIFASLDNKEIAEEFIRKFQEQKIHGIQYDELILSTKDPEFILECLKNEENFNIKKSNFIIKAIKKGYTIEEIEKFGEEIKIPSSVYYFFHGDKDKALSEIQKNKPQDLPKLDLPEEMTIGIEIESVGPFGIDLYSSIDVFGWEAKMDGSLHGKEMDTGVEVVSPILTGDNEKTAESIANTVSFIKDCGHYANDTCGGHIHIGANYLDSTEAIYNFLELWSNNEEFFYIISNAEGELPRDGISQYAPPISRELYDEMEDGSINITNLENIETLKEKMVDAQNSRYKGINFQNLAEGGKGTIEFRLSNGTVEPKTWIENVNLFGGLVRAAKEISLIQKKPENKRTKEDVEKLNKFEKVTQANMLQDMNQKFNDLLDLIVSPENKKTYLNRYITNDKLLEQNPGKKVLLDIKISKNRVVLQKHKLERLVFTGNNVPTFEEIKEAKDFMEQGLNKTKEKSRDEK